MKNPLSSSLLLLLLVIFTLNIAIAEEVSCTSDADCSTGMECLQGICNVTDTTQNISSFSNSEKSLAFSEIDPEIVQILGLTSSDLIVQKRKYSSVPVSFTEINTNYLPKGITKFDVLGSQNDIEVTADMVFFIHTSSLGSKNMTFVKKTIKTKLKKYMVIEEFPAEFISSLDSLSFTQEPKILSDTAPIAVSFNNPTEISYIVEGDATQYIYDIQTIVIPTTPLKVRGNKYKGAICGDGVCTSLLEDKTTCPKDCTRQINWFFIIFLLIVMVVGILYFNYWRSKRKFKKPKSPFSSPKDETNLRNYIKTAKAQGKNIDEIKQGLLSKGWTTKQIDYIFKTS